MSSHERIRIDLGEDIRFSALAFAFLAIVLGVTQCSKCVRDDAPLPAAKETPTP